MHSEAEEEKKECDTERETGTVESPFLSSKGFDGVFDYVGGGNIFQWLLMAAVSLQGCVLVTHHLGFVFLGAVPDHWCRVGELETSSWTGDQIKNISIPWKTLPSISCVIVALLSLPSRLLGRRKAILFACTLIMVSGLAAAFAKSFMAFSVFRFLVAVGVSGSYQNCFVLQAHFDYGPENLELFFNFTFSRVQRVGRLLEYSDKSYRSLLGIIQQMPFAIGYMTIPLYAYFIRRWDHLQLAFAVTSFTLVSYFWILPESARWLASKERDDEAIERLHSVAKWNRRPLPSKEVLLPLLETCREEQSASTKKRFWPRLWENTCLTLSNYLNLVQTPELRRRSFAIWTLFTCVALVYYGVVFDSASLTKDPFLIVFLGGLMEVPAYTLIQPLVSRWGRRPTLILLFTLTAVVFFAFVATPKELETIRIVFSMSGKLFISSAFAVIYLLGAELYPTSARITGLGSAVLMGRFGSILAPYVVAGLATSYRDLPTAIFGVAALIGAVVSGFLPETKDLEMTDIVAEVEDAAQPITAELPFVSHRKSSKDTSNQKA